MEEIEQMYYREISEIELLTAEEEIELARRTAEGDREARERLITANLRLAAAVAGKYKGRGMSMEDLIQEANTGLTLAADKFDYTKGCRFSTYAVYWIAETVMRAISKQGRSVRLPQHLTDMKRRLDKAERQLTSSLGRAPKAEELARELGMTVGKLEWIRSASREAVSLDAPAGEDGDACTGDFVPDAESLTPYEQAERKLRCEAVMEALDRLAPREKQVLILRYGFGGGRECTLEELGRRFGLTRERVRQIEQKALRKLRRPEFVALLSA